MASDNTTVQFSSLGGKKVPLGLKQQKLLSRIVPFFTLELVEQYLWALAMMLTC